MIRRWLAALAFGVFLCIPAEVPAQEQLDSPSQISSDEIAQRIIWMQDLLLALPNQSAKQRQEIDEFRVNYFKSEPVPAAGPEARRLAAFLDEIWRYAREHAGKALEACEAIELNLDPDGIAPPISSLTAECFAAVTKTKALAVAEVHATIRQSRERIPSEIVLDLYHNADPIDYAEFRNWLEAAGPRYLDGLALIGRTWVRASGEQDKESEAAPVTLALRHERAARLAPELVRLLRSSNVELLRRNLPVSSNAQNRAEDLEGLREALRALLAVDPASAPLRLLEAAKSFAEALQLTYSRRLKASFDQVRAAKSTMSPFAKDMLEEFQRRFEQAEPGRAHVSAEDAAVWMENELRGRFYDIRRTLTPFLNSNPGTSQSCYRRPVLGPAHLGAWVPVDETGPDSPGTENTAAVALSEDNLDRFIKDFWATVESCLRLAKAELRVGVPETLLIDTLCELHRGGQSDATAILKGRGLVPVDRCQQVRDDTTHETAAVPSDPIGNYVTAANLVLASRLLEEPQLLSLDLSQLFRRSPEFTRRIGQRASLKLEDLVDEERRTFLGTEEQIRKLRQTVDRELRHHELILELLSKPLTLWPCDNGTGISLIARLSVTENEEEILALGGEIKAVWPNSEQTSPCTESAFNKSAVGRQLSHETATGFQFSDLGLPPLENGSIYDTADSIREMIRSGVWKHLPKLDPYASKANNKGNAGQSFVWFARQLGLDPKLLAALGGGHLEIRLLQHGAVQLELQEDMCLILALSSDPKESDCRSIRLRGAPGSPKSEGGKNDVTNNGTWVAVDRQAVNRDILDWLLEDIVRPGIEEALQQPPIGPLLEELKAPEFEAIADALRSQGQWIRAQDCALPPTLSKECALKIRIGLGPLIAAMASGTDLSSQRSQQLRAVFGNGQILGSLSAKQGVKLRVRLPLEAVAHGYLGQLQGRLVLLSASCLEPNPTPGCGLDGGSRYEVRFGLRTGANKVTSPVVAVIIHNGEVERVEKTGPIAPITLATGVTVAIGEVVVERDTGRIVFRDTILNSNRDPLKIELENVDIRVERDSNGGNDFRIVAGGPGRPLQTVSLALRRRGLLPHGVEVSSVSISGDDFRLELSVDETKIAEEQRAELKKLHSEAEKQLKRLSAEWRKTPAIAELIEKTKSFEMNVRALAELGSSELRRFKAMLTKGRDELARSLPSRGSVASAGLKLFEYNCSGNERSGGNRFYRRCDVRLVPGALPCAEPIVLSFQRSGSRLQIEPGAGRKIEECIKSTIGSAARNVSLGRAKLSPWYQNDKDGSEVVQGVEVFLPVNVSLPGASEDELHLRLKLGLNGAFEVHDSVEQVLAHLRHLARDEAERRLKELVKDRTADLRANLQELGARWKTQLSDAFSRLGNVTCTWDGGTLDGRPCEDINLADGGDLPGGVRLAVGIRLNGQTLSINGLRVSFEGEIDFSSVKVEDEDDVIESWIANRLPFDQDDIRNVSWHAERAGLILNVDISLTLPLLQAPVPVRLSARLDASGFHVSGDMSGEALRRAAAQIAADALNDHLLPLQVDFGETALFLDNALISVTGKPDLLIEARLNVWEDISVSANVRIPLEGGTPKVEWDKEEAERRLKERLGGQLLAQLGLPSIGGFEIVSVEPIIEDDTPKGFRVKSLIEITEVLKGSLPVIIVTRHGLKFEGTNEITLLYSGDIPVPPFSLTDVGGTVRQDQVELEGSLTFAQSSFKHLLKMRGTYTLPLDRLSRLESVSELILLSVLPLGYDKSTIDVDNALIQRDIHVGGVLSDIVSMNIDAIINGRQMTLSGDGDLSLFKSRLANGSVIANLRNGDLQASAAVDLGDIVTAQASVASDIGLTRPHLAARADVIRILGFTIAGADVEANRRMAAMRLNVLGIRLGLTAPHLSLFSKDALKDMILALLSPDLENLDKALLELLKGNFNINPFGNFGPDKGGISGEGGDATDASNANGNGTASGTGGSSDNKQPGKSGSHGADTGTGDHRDLGQHAKAVGDSFDNSEGRGPIGELGTANATGGPAKGDRGALMPRGEWSFNASPYSTNDALVELTLSSAGTKKGRIALSPLKILETEQFICSSADTCSAAGRPLLFNERMFLQAFKQAENDTVGNCVDDAATLYWTIGKSEDTRLSAVLPLDRIAGATLCFTPLTSGKPGTLDPTVLKAFLYDAALALEARWTALRRPGTDREINDLVREAFWLSNITRTQVDQGIGESASQPHTYQALVVSYRPDHYVLYTRRGQDGPKLLTVAMANRRDLEDPDYLYELLERLWNSENGTAELIQRPQDGPGIRPPYVVSEEGLEYYQNGRFKQVKRPDHDGSDTGSDLHDSGADWIGPERRDLIQKQITEQQAAEQEAAERQQAISAADQGKPLIQGNCGLKIEDLDSEYYKVLSDGPGCSGAQITRMLKEVSGLPTAEIKDGALVPSGRVLGTSNGYIALSFGDQLCAGDVYWLFDDGKFVKENGAAICEGAIERENGDAVRVYADFVQQVGRRGAESSPRIVRAIEPLLADGDTNKGAFLVVDYTHAKQSDEIDRTAHVSASTGTIAVELDPAIPVNIFDERGFQSALIAAADVGARHLLRLTTEGGKAFYLLNQTLFYHDAGGGLDLGSIRLPEQFGHGSDNALSPNIRAALERFLTEHFDGIASTNFSTFEEAEAFETTKFVGVAARLLAPTDVVPSRNPHSIKFARLEQVTTPEPEASTQFEWDNKIGQTIQSTLCWLVPTLVGEEREADDLREIVKDFIAEERSISVAGINLHFDQFASLREFGEQFFEPFGGSLDFLVSHQQDILSLCDRYYKSIESVNPDIPLIQPLINERPDLRWRSVLHFAGALERFLAGEDAGSNGAAQSRLSDSAIALEFASGRVHNFHLSRHSALKNELLERILAKEEQNGQEPTTLQLYRFSHSILIVSPTLGTETLEVLFWSGTEALPLGTLDIAAADNAELSQLYLAAVVRDIAAAVRKSSSKTELPEILDASAESESGQIGYRLRLAGGNAKASNLTVYFPSDDRKSVHAITLEDFNEGQLTDGRTSRIFGYLIDSGVERAKLSPSSGRHHFLHHDQDTLVAFDKSGENCWRFDGIPPSDGLDEAYDRFLTLLSNHLTTQVGSGGTSPKCSPE